MKFVKCLYNKDVRDFSFKELFEQILKSVSPEETEISTPSELKEIEEETKTPSSIKNALESGLVEFWYRKVDDKSLRHANGTRDPKLLPLLYGYTQPSGNPTSPSVTIYWDTDRQDWRCFRTSNFVRIEDYVPTDEIVEE